MNTTSTMVGAICLLVVFAVIYIYYEKYNDRLLKHRGFIEMLPSLVSTSGVLGTFAGITMGLYHFDTTNLSASIPLLLDGLRTAFFTSLAGMIGSLLLSWLVNRCYDKKTGGVNDSVEAASIVVQALADMQNQQQNQINTQNAFYVSVQQSFQKIADTATQMLGHIGQLNVAINNLNVLMQDVKKDTGFLNRIFDDEENVKERMTELCLTTANMAQVLSSVNEVTSAINSKGENLLLSVGNIEDRTANLLSVITNQNNSVGEILDHASALVSGQEETKDHVSKFGDRLHSEILEIEDKMGETNSLLTTKFDEFSELLKKSNTEALVEVMKNVTEEFQKQMSALIEKLVQENFEQLNTSVERLNTWQQENKEMIKSLTLQYKQMETDFENTSTSLKKVDEDTRQLVSEGGKLHQIVAALNKVIVEDEKFIKISTDLQATADLTKTNFEQFDASTRALNDWVRKQRNFVDGVTALIAKLEELNKLRDYGEQFWKGTREHMEEGVGIIRNGTEALNNQVQGLNSQFYARLSTTLAQLDNCIQSLIVNAEKRK